MKRKNDIPQFNVPEGYFESFEDEVFCKISEESFPNSRGFKTPDNYFDSFDLRIMNTLMDSEKPIKTIPLFSKKHIGYAAAIAASLVLVFTFFNNKTTQQNLDTINLAAIDSYIEEGNLNLDFYDLTSIIDDSDISRLDIQKQQISLRALEDYLFENIDSENLINEQ